MGKRSTLKAPAKGGAVEGWLRRLLIPATIVSLLVYMGWRVFFTLPFGYGTASMFFGVCLIIAEAMGVFEAIIHFYAMSDTKSPERPCADTSLFPTVDIFIATYNEPPELLYKTVNGCVNLDYPDKSKVKVYICDDGRRDAVRELAEKFGVGHIIREDNKHAKAGNLNNALSVTGGELIVTLDADMIPMSDFLMATVPYFVAEENLGFLQTPQAFYNMDLYQYYLYSEERVPNEQDYFYKTVEVSRNKLNTVIYGGSNTIISRKALAASGGFVTDVITEDFATGMAIQSNGFKSLAIADVHASGLSPEDLKSLIRQRERWARGCIQTGRKLKILFRKGLSLKQKLSYISSITYWYGSFKRLFYIASPIVFSLFGVVVVRCSIAELIMFWLPMYVLNRSSVKLLSNNIRSTKWSNIYDTLLFPSLLPVVLLELMGMTKTQFSVTRKDGVVESDKKYQMRQMLPHAIMGLLTIAALTRSLGHIFMTGSVQHLYIIFWLLVNAYYITMSIFFMMGRDGYPEIKRAKAGIDCLLGHGNRGVGAVKCVTETISEEEITVRLSEPVYFADGEEISVRLSSGRYDAGFNAIAVDVSRDGCGFLYTFKITQLDEKDYKQLLLLIYDRPPTGVMYLTEDISGFDDIRINISERLKKLRKRREYGYGNDGGRRSSIPGIRLRGVPRRLPEIPVFTSYETDGGDIAELICFYYEYALVKLLGERLPMKHIIRLGDGLELICAYDKLIAPGTVLYSISNCGELARSAKMDTLVRFWLENCGNDAVGADMEDGVMGTDTDRADRIREDAAYATYVAYLGEYKADERYEFDEMLYI